MSIPLLMGSICVAGILAFLLFPAIKQKLPNIHPVFLLTLFVVPFVAGGFSTWCAVPASALLMWYLYRIIRDAGHCKFNINLNSVAVIAVFLAFVITPLWAADKGMAVFGFVRYLPVLLFYLILMQLPSQQRQDGLLIVPLCGAIMTVLCFVLQFIPALHNDLTVSERLSGGFDYPNTYAAFLLAGLIIQCTKDKLKLQDMLISAILIFGIIISGSRTAFLLLIPALGYILIVRRAFRLILALIAFAAVGLLGAWALAALNMLPNADRFTTISLSASTFVVRFLYFKDALGVILRHPFGIGYWGYYAMEGSFQTGSYCVTFVHNGLLQLLLDVGWVPALLMAAAFIKTIFHKSTSHTSRGVLLIVLAHCMLDFDLQFSAIWFLLLCTMDFQQGKTLTLPKGGNAAKIFGVILLILSLWLGAGDFCMALGKPTACLKILPFHTESLIYAISDETDPVALDKAADNILAKNKYSSIAYSAKANAAFAQGDILEMINYKEQAIACAKYITKEYCDYLDKLSVAYDLYLQAGDWDSAKYCANKILYVETMIRQLAETTSPLAYRTGDDPDIHLPEKYEDFIEVIRTVLSN